MKSDKDFLESLKGELKGELRKKKLLYDVLSEGWLPSKDLILKEQLKKGLGAGTRFRRIALGAAAAVILITASLVVLLLLSSDSDSEQNRKNMAVTPEYIRDVDSEEPQLPVNKEKGEPVREHDLQNEPSVAEIEPEAAQELPGKKEQQKRRPAVKVARSIPSAEREKGNVRISVSRASSPSLITVSVIRGNIEDSIPEGYTLALTELEGSQTNAYLIKSEPDPDSLLFPDIRFETWY